MQSRRTFFGSALGAAAGLAAPPSEPAWYSIADAAELVRLGRLSPVELTQSCLRRIEKLNKTLNAFITVTAEQALARAKTLEQEVQYGRWRGPLHGIPIALKDLIDTAGVRTTAASAHWKDRVPTEDAEVVRRLNTAGAILLGKLNMDEFAYNFTSETSVFGSIRNPWATRRSPGGSSGGSAVAVAAGMCLGALGSDTGGSIRLPAALCGITGLKPAYGRVSTRGVAPLAWSLDHVGPMCRSARDAALLLSGIAGRDPRDPATLHDRLPQPDSIFRLNVKSFRLGVPRDSIFFQRIDPRMDQAVNEALKVLSRLTAGIEEVRLPPLDLLEEMPGFPRAYSVLIRAEAYAFHEEMLKRNPERYHPGTRASIEGGSTIPTTVYIGARREMERLRVESGALFNRADLLITPAAPAPAFELTGRGDLIFLRNAAPWNLYGLPSICIPCGFTRDRLPMGLQITGPAGLEDMVLALADAYQRETDWHMRRPQ